MDSGERARGSESHPSGTSFGALAGGTDSRIARDRAVRPRYLERVFGLVEFAYQIVRKTAHKEHLLRGEEQAALEMVPAARKIC